MGNEMLAVGGGKGIGGGGGGGWIPAFAGMTEGGWGKRRRDGGGA